MGGGNKKGGAPAAPDFSKLAMVNQSNPLGGVSWSRDPQGNLSMNSQFSGAGKGIFDSLLGGMQSGAGFNPATAGDEARNAVQGFQESRLNPLWEQRNQSFQSQMANQGLSPGMTAFGNASRQLGQQENDAYSQAMAQSYGLGLQEQEAGRRNAMLPFALGQGMMGMLPQGNANAPFASGMAQYNASKDKASAENSKKGSAMGGLGNIAGVVF